MKQERCSFIGPLQSLSLSLLQFIITVISSGYRSLGSLKSWTIDHRRCYRTFFIFSLVYTIPGHANHWGLLQQLSQSALTTATSVTVLQNTNFGRIKVICFLTVSKQPQGRSPCICLGRGERWAGLGSAEIPQGDSGSAQCQQHPKAQAGLASSLRKHEINHRHIWQVWWNTGVTEDEHYLSVKPTI